METMLGALLVFCMRTCDMSLGTIRMIFIVQGRRVLAAATGFVEVTIFVLAIAKVLSSLTDVWHILGYSGGFALGTYLGMFIEAKLSMGCSLARIVSRDFSEDVAGILWEHGFGASVFDASGKKGPVKITHSFCRRKDIRKLLTLVDIIDPKAFVTVHDARLSRHGYLNPVKKR